MEAVVVTIIAVLALLVVFGLGASPPPPPAPTPPAPPVIDILTAERGLLITKIDLELRTVELSLRQSGSVQAAEGAALVRARTIEFLRGYK